MSFKMHVYWFQQVLGMINYDVFPNLLFNYKLKILNYFWCYSFPFNDFKQAIIILKSKLNYNKSDSINSNIALRTWLLNIKK